jgi:hypothetical protein
VKSIGGDNHKLLAALLHTWAGRVVRVAELHP